MLRYQRWILEAAILRWASISGAGGGGTRVLSPTELGRSDLEFGRELPLPVEILFLHLSLGQYCPLGLVSTDWIHYS